MRRSEGRIHSAPAIHEIISGNPNRPLGGLGKEDPLRAARTLVADYAAGLEGVRED